MRYDAFISYSHAGDDLLSERVQTGLQRFAKPWWRRRALTVFRDRTGLSANPGLWTSISEAIDNSRFFVLLASPEAAHSDWVGREVAQWRARHGSENLLLLLTSGELVWAEDRDDFDWTATTALSAAAFMTCFAEEPRHVDMRWARSEVQLDLSDGRFRDQIAELAAPIHGVAKDELAGEDVRQHRRTLRTAVAAGIALFVLTLAALATSIFAVNAAGAARRSAAHARSEQKRADQAAQLAVASGKEAQTQRALAEVRRREAERDATKARNSAHEAELQRAAAKLSADQAQLSADEAQQQKEQAQVSADEAQLEKAKALVSADEAERQRQLTAQANVQLQQTNSALETQQQDTEDQRLAGVARQLAIGSKAALDAGNTDTGLLLAAESTKFAIKSHGRIPGSDLQPALVDALQNNQHVVGWLRGLDGPIADVAAAPDNRHAAAVSTDSRAAVWDLASRELLARFAVPAGTAYIRFLDSNTIVVAGTHRVDEYRATSSGWLHAWTRLTPSALTVSALAATPHRVLVASSEGGSFAGSSDLDLFDARGARLAAATEPDSVVRVAIAPSGAFFASADSNFPTSDEAIGAGARVYASSGAQLYAYPLAVAQFGPLAGDLRFSSDSRQLAVVGPFPVPLHEWSLDTGAEIPVQLDPFSSWSSIVPDAAIGLSPNLNHIVERDPNNENVIGIGDMTAESFAGGIQAPATFGSVLGLSQGTDAFAPPAFTPDNKMFLTSAGTGVVPVFAIAATGARIAHLQDFGAVSDSTGVAALSPDDRTLAFTEARTPDGQGHNRLRIITLDGSRAPLDIALARAPALLELIPYSTKMAFSDAGTELALSYQDASVDVFDTRTGARRLHLAPLSSCGGGCLADLAFFGSLEHGRLAETAHAQLWSWTLHDGTALSHQVVDFPGAYATLLPSFNASGTRLLVASDVLLPSVKVTAHVFETTPSGWARRESFPVEIGSSAVLSPDGSTVVEATGGHITRYDVNAGGRIAWRVAADDQQLWLAPDGSLYGSNLNGDIIRRRSMQTGSVELTLNKPGPSIFASTATLGFAHDHVVAVNFGYPDVLVTDWALAPSDLAASACDEAGRNLTRDEWTQYVGRFDAYEKTCAQWPPG